jgi:hypothetical protein
MSKDKVEHYYLITTTFLMSGMSSSSLNIWNATWNPHIEDPRGCWAHCIEVPKWQVNAVPIGKKGLFFFPFVTPSCASPKALHDQQYQLETLRDWIIVNKTYKYCTKGVHGQQYQLETLRDWIFVNKTYKKLTSSKQVGGRGTLAGDVV